MTCFTESQIRKARIAHGKWMVEAKERARHSIHCRGVVDLGQPAHSARLRRPLALQNGIVWVVARSAWPDIYAGMSGTTTASPTASPTAGRRSRAQHLSFIPFRKGPTTVFVKQVVRRFHAASLISGVAVSFSGLSQTGPAGCQFRVLPDQRSGFFARAFA